MIKKILVIVFSVLMVSGCSAQETDVNRLMNNANYYFILGQYSKSEKILNQVIKLDSNNKEAYLMKAVLIKKPKEAQLFINEVALKKFPNDSVLLFKLASSYYKEGKFENAINTLNKISSQDKKDKIYILLGDCYSQMYQFDNAVKAYTEAIKLNPNMDEAYMRRAKACGDNSDWKCSLANYEILKKMHPDKFIFYYMTSLYKTNIKDLNGAMDDIDKAIKLSSKEESFLYAQKAWVYLEQKDYANAKKLLQKALTINNKDQYTLDLLCVMAYENNAYDKAIIACNRSIKYAIVPNPITLIIKAKSYYKLGEKKKAISIMDKVIKEIPYDDKYKSLREKMINGQSVD